MSQLERELPRPIDILLVEDDPSDVLLTKRGLESNKLHNTLSVVKDGIEALQFLRQENQFADSRRPDPILLDLNMPRMDGRELLRKLKVDESLKRIPVVVLTTSDADTDIAKSYDLQASCFVAKPVKLDQFSSVVRHLQDFWVSIVKYSPKKFATSAHRFASEATM